MILIVGLGNPGKKFEKTRHNVGFLAIENLKLESKKISSSPPSPRCVWGSVTENFSDWKYKKKFQAEISQGRINNKELILIKPQTFMNESGKAVKLLTKIYHLSPKTLFVIHDDIDLSLGKIRISVGRGAAGHRGVQSIIDELGTKNFVRFRLGVEPKTYNLKPNTLCDFVLQKFNKEEEKILKEVIKKTVEAIECYLELGPEKAMQKFNK